MVFCAVVSRSSFVLGRKMKTPEEEAREYAKLNRYEGICDFSEGNLKLSKYAEKEVLRRVEQAHLKGQQLGAEREREKHRWIPVSERLPVVESKKETFLVYTPNYEFNGDNGVREERYCDVKWDTNSVDRVTHWQPLPAAPEAKEGKR